MSVADRLNQVIGFLGKEEAVYSVAEVLSDTDDGILPYLAEGDPEPPQPIEYVFDGNIGRSPGTLAPAKRAAPAGRFRQGNVQSLFRGRGTAYAAPDTPPNEVHRLLKAAGLDASYSASPTPQWTYAPTAAGTTFTSLTLEQYAQGSRFPMSGVICSWAFEASGLGVPIHTFDYRGIATLPADSMSSAILRAESWAVVAFFLKPASVLSCAA
jgi:hypothetical protein